MVSVDTMLAVAIAVGFFCTTLGLVLGYAQGVTDEARKHEGRG